MQNLKATTSEVVHLKTLWSVHYKPLQEVHSIRYSQIVLYKPDPSWVLVVVNFLDGSERWGTIKSDRYKKSELKNDDLFAEMKYGCWLVNNDSHRFVFDRETRIFSEIRSGRVLGKYTFEEFDQLTKERGMVGEFSPYEFNIDKQ